LTKNEYNQTQQVITGIGAEIKRVTEPHWAKFWRLGKSQNGQMA
jgi:hypothetical protein